MTKHEKINYIEYPAQNIPATKAFFKTVFAWEFEDFGSDYTAFHTPTLDGGFFRSDLSSQQQRGAALLIFYSQDLHATQSKIAHAGGKITQAIYAFPGGSRFHFTEPSGNEFAVWSDAIITKDQS